MEHRPNHPRAARCSWGTGRRAPEPLPLPLVPCSKPFCELSLVSKMRKLSTKASFTEPTLGFLCLCTIDIRLWSSFSGFGKMHVETPTAMGKLGHPFISGTTQTSGNKPHVGPIISLFTNREKSSHTQEQSQKSQICRSDTSVITSVITDLSYQVPKKNLTAVLHPSHRLVVEDIDGVVVALGLCHTSLSAGRGRMQVGRELEIQLLQSTSEIFHCAGSRKPQKRLSFCGLDYMLCFYMFLSFSFVGCSGSMSSWWLAIVESCRIRLCFFVVLEARSKKAWTMLPHTDKNLPPRNAFQKDFMTMNWRMLLLRKWKNCENTEIPMSSHFVTRILKHWKATVDLLGVISFPKVTKKWHHHLTSKKYGDCHYCNSMASPRLFPRLFLRFFSLARANHQIPSKIDWHCMILPSFPANFSPL